MHRELSDRFSARALAQLGIITVILLTATRAAGEPPAAPQPQAAERSLPWDGMYVGGHVGYARGAASTTIYDSDERTSTSSFGMLGGGLHLGYARLLRSRFLLGLEADASVPNFLENDDRLSSSDVSIGRIEERVDASGGLRARAGYAFSRSLVYGIGGFAWSLGRFTRSPGVDMDEEKQWRVHPGWTVGAGFEIPVASDWTARLEYRYDQLERASTGFTSGPNSASTVGIHSVWLGLGWHIPGTGSARPGVQHVDPTAGGRDDEDPQMAAPDQQRPLVPSVITGTQKDEDGWNIHGQTTFVGQGYPGFRSPYEGAQSLSGAGQFKNTVSVTAFLGLRLWRNGELYFNPEIMQGFGLSDVRGVAAFPNGEAQKSNFPSPRFNAARIFLSQTFTLGNEQELVDDGPNQLSGKRRISRLTVSVGKFAVTDYFLINRYAGEPRTGFLNWNIYGGGSYDWTMDLLSWTWGALVDLNQKRWALRAGYFLLPVHASTNYFDTRIPSHGQYTAEGELRYAPFGRPGKVQLFGWMSHGNIGSYEEALAQPMTTPNYPDVALTRDQDRSNYGVVLGAEQALTDDLGVFSRVSWSPERVESMGWTDCGESFSLGGTHKGTLWRRPDDTLGLAGVVEALSPVTRRYLAAGGMGILIGDGRLNYRPEAVLEAYYAYSPFDWATVTLDYQFVVNPGYNADRGPVSIFAIRLHAAY